MTQENNTQLVSYEEERLARINDVAEELASMGMPSYAFKDGNILTPSGGAILKKEMDVIILSAPWDISVFGATWVAGCSDPPIASAFGLTKVDGQIVNLAYNELVFSSRSHQDYAGIKCVEHPACEFDSAPKGGKGKMAREKRRLLFIPAERIAGIGDLTADDVFSLQVPPASLSGYNKHLKSLGKSYISDFITRVRVHPVNDKVLQFTKVGAIDENLYSSLFTLMKNAERVVYEKENSWVASAQDTPATKKRKYSTGV